MYALICAFAEARRARSACPSILGSTSAANSAMIVTTTIISISVTPAWRRLFRFMVTSRSLHRDIVHTHNRQQNTQNQRADDHSHNQNDERLKQRRKSPDRRACIGVVDVRHLDEHRIQPSGL